MVRHFPRHINVHAYSELVNVRALVMFRSQRYGGHLLVLAGSWRRGLQ